LLNGRPALMDLSVMARLYRTSVWQVELPDEWKVRALYSDGAVIYRPDGIGKLMVLVRPEDMEPPSLNYKTENRYSGQLPGFHRKSPASAGNSRSWTLFCGKQVLLIQYSCAAHHAGVEDDEVDLIVSSIARSDEPDQD